MRWKMIFSKKCNEIFSDNILRFVNFGTFPFLFSVDVVTNNVWKLLKHMCDN